MITHPLLRIVGALMFGCVLVMHTPWEAAAQTAPSAQGKNAIFADQLRQVRSKSVVRAFGIQQEAQFAAAQETARAQAAAAQAFAEAETAKALAAAQPALRIGASPEGDVLLEGGQTLMGQGLVPVLAGGGDVTFQINIQAGSGNVAGNTQVGD